MSADINSSDTLINQNDNKIDIMDTFIQVLDRLGEVENLNQLLIETGVEDDSGIECEEYITVGELSKRSINNLHSVALSEQGIYRLFDIKLTKNEDPKNFDIEKTQEDELIFESAYRRVFRNIFSRKGFLQTEKNLSDRAIVEVFKRARQVLSVKSIQHIYSVEMFEGVFGQWITPFDTSFDKSHNGEYKYHTNASRHTTHKGRIEIFPDWKMSGVELMQEFLKKELGQDSDIDIDKLSKEILALIIVSHETGHGIEDALLIPKRKNHKSGYSQLGLTSIQTTRISNQEFTAELFGVESTLSEGFAVGIEILNVQHYLDELFEAGKLAKRIDYGNFRSVKNEQNQKFILLESKLQKVYGNLCSIFNEYQEEDSDLQEVRPQVAVLLMNHLMQIIRCMQDNNNLPLYESGEYEKAAYQYLYLNNPFNLKEIIDIIKERLGES